MTTLTLTNIVTLQYICLTLQGDSGGALSVLQTDGRFTQVGIVSFGSSAGCQRGHPLGCTKHQTQVLVLDKQNKDKDSKAQHDFY